MTIWKTVFAALFSAMCLTALAQTGNKVSIKITGENQQSLFGATAELLAGSDSSLRKIQLTDSAGTVVFQELPAGEYLLRISHLGYNRHTTPAFFISADGQVELPTVALQLSGSTLSSVTVAARKAFIETRPGKTVVNMDAGISNAGATVMEALEKMPGITIDKDGNISLKGKSGVTVLINGKQTYLDAAQLSTLLSGMNASQLGQVEIMDQPSSEFDAAGNAGVINLRLKKNTQRGFNGNLTTSFSQGFYPKNNNSLQLNFRSGAFNWFLNYGANFLQNFTRIEALRTYLRPDGITVASMLEQPSFLKGRANIHNLRTGVDYTLGAKTTVGLTLNGLSLWRKGNGNNKALWLDANRRTDSLIQTHSRTRNDWKNGGINLNLRHAFTASRDLSVDADLIGYRIGGDQFFENNGLLPTVYTEASKADLPSTIRIFSAKADYAEQRQAWKLKAGAKTSRIKTDNLAAYTYLDGTTWKEDLGRTNHFLYTETIHALYGNAETKLQKWSLQGGLRYESTHYDAAQLGNAVVKDSSFSRSYNSLFPAAFASYELDSVHTFSFSAGRRIDRPPFQKLNPFLFIINKYTFQQGNPFYRPQYTWNMELSHQYKSVLVTGVNYSVAHDYFSQIFPVNSNGIVIYTEGNLRRLQTWGASVSVQLSPLQGWSLSAQGQVLHKKMEGFIEREYKASVTQGSLTLNNQLRFSKGWAAEVSGFYTSRSQNDIQEIVDPAGQLTVGVSKTVWQNKGTIKLSGRDLFYTQWMKGFTMFRLSNEYFKLTRDTRLLTLSFSYRFGKVFKASRRTQGAAGEEIERVGNG